MPSTPKEAPAGQARLGLWDAISIIVGIVIGTTIFKVPWLIFLNVSDPWMGLLVWVFGGVLALIGAMCYAELATTYPRDGGDYVYLSKAFGGWVGYLFGWGQLVVVLPASIGAMAVVFAEFAVKFPELKQLWEDQGLIPEVLWAITAVVVISLLNILGVAFGKTTQNILTLAKIIGLGAILVAGFSTVSFENLEPTPLANSPGWQTLAIILVFYAYGGWNDAAFVAAEVRNPRRNIPLALILGVSGITVIYLLINAAYLLGQGFEGARVPNQLNPERLLTSVWGEWGGKAISVIIMVSALGAVNALVFTGSRVYSTLGADHRLFALLSRTTRLGSPVFSLILQALITVGMVLALGTRQGHEAINQLLVSVQLVKEAPEWKTGDAFEALVAHTFPVFWGFFLMTGLSLFVLREQNPNRERPFSVPLYPVLPIIFCNVCVYMIYHSTIYVTWQRALLCLVLLVLGLPLYWISRAMSGNSPDPIANQPAEKMADYPAATRANPFS